MSHYFIHNIFINLCYCRSRYPKRTSDLKEFESHLLQGAREMPELKLWQLQGETIHILDNRTATNDPFSKDLGFQAAQRINAAGSDFGLQVLKDISQNLPIQAK